LTLAAAESIDAPITDEYVNRSPEIRSEAEKEDNESSPGSSRLGNTNSNLILN